MKIERETRYDLLRLIALFAFMVAATVTRSHDFLTELGRDFAVLQIFLSVFSFGMPLFVMLSGAFLLDPERPFDLKTHFLKRVLRLVLALVCWGLFYGAVQFVMSKQAFDLLDFIKTSYLYRRLICVLFVMLGLYLCVPVFRCITKDKRVTEYFLIGCIIIGSLIPALKLNPTLYKISYFTDSMQFPLFMGYGGLFVAGAYLRKYPPKRLLRFIIYAAGVIGLILTILVFGLDITQRAYFTFESYNGSTLYQFAYAAAIFTFFTKPDFMVMNPTGTRLFTRLSGLCFGAYLSSLGVFKLLRVIGLWGLGFSPVLAVPATAICAFVIALGISYLISLIPIVRRYLV